jgi:hypothetical protein
LPIPAFAPVIRMVRPGCWVTVCSFIHDGPWVGRVPVTAKIAIRHAIAGRLNDPAANVAVTTDM